ncbi:MBL fold metallo-hydrolase [Longimicrobium sp.]|uniref:MBL fold metallo-hydrolase n=1 Tax=Longimicrobium sp. TaxID=2029185 RepID=UPI002CDB5F0B|nr:MBL fold metallo-hydrolase [Longimicrobium sp.]HSU15466.1 MBL fold metallo-hydrolase [Longimicrobium sp.]
METVDLGGGAHVLRGAVNSGLVETENGLLAIDTGLDRGAANRIARAAEELRRPIVAILNTHAHADHHGGNAQLVRRFGVPVHAAAVEEAVIREPRYEPVYLYGGAAPISALTSKFLQAEPSPVDHVVRPGETVTIDGRELAIVDLVGHSLAQIGVRAGGVLFAADGFFGREPLEKHGVPYLVDSGRWMETLRALGEVDAAWMVPGHGEPVDDPRDTLALNLRVLQDASDWLRGRFHRGPARTEDLLVEFAEAMGMRLVDPPSYVLNRAAMLGFLSTLEREGAVRVEISGGRWTWMAAET